MKREKHAVSVMMTYKDRQILLQNSFKVAQKYSQTLVKVAEIRKSFSQNIKEAKNIIYSHSCCLIY